MTPRSYWQTTARLGFGYWQPGDTPLAQSLWGDAEVTRYISANGQFTPQQVSARLAQEIQNDTQYGVQYWPVFLLQSGDFVGCCGLRPYAKEAGVYELGFHLRPGFWGRGYGSEAARAVMAYAFGPLHAGALFAGHHPQNKASAALLCKLGFCFVGEQFYAPTGLNHPSYRYTPSAGGNIK